VSNTVRDDDEQEEEQEEEEGEEGGEHADVKRRFFLGLSLASSCWGLLAGSPLCGFFKFGVDSEGSSGRLWSTESVLSKHNILTENEQSGPFFVTFVSLDLNRPCLDFSLLYSSGLDQ
jgi:hypothetical protein